MQLHQFKRNLEKSILHRNKFNVSIICAFSEEFEQLTQSFKRCPWLKIDYTSLPYVFQTTTIHTRGMNDVRIIAACADKAEVCAPFVLTTALYTTFQVNAVFMTN